MEIHDSVETNGIHEHVEKCFVHRVVLLEIEIYGCLRTQAILNTGQVRYVG